MVEERLTNMARMSSLSDVIDCRMSVASELMRSPKACCSWCKARCAPNSCCLVTKVFESSPWSMKGGLVEELGLCIIPSQYVSGGKRRTYTKCTLTKVESGSMITQMWNKEIAQLVPILVDSHTYTSKSLWWSSVRMVA